MEQRFPKIQRSPQSVSSYLWYMLMSHASFHYPHSFFRSGGLLWFFKDRQCSTMKNIISNKGHQENLKICSHSPFSQHSLIKIKRLLYLNLWLLKCNGWPHGSSDKWGPSIYGKCCLSWKDVLYKQRLKLEASQGSVKLYSARSIQVWEFFFNVESSSRPQQRQEGERGKKGKASETLLLQRQSCLNITICVKQHGFVNYILLLSRHLHKRPGHPSW